MIHCWLLNEIDGLVWMNKISIGWTEWKQQRDYRSKSDESSDMDDDYDPDDDEQGGTTTTEPDPTDSSRDEVGEVRKMSSRDTFWLRLWRIVVTSVLLLTALAVTFTRYTLLQQQEEANFHTAVSFCCHLNHPWNDDTYICVCVHVYSLHLILLTLHHQQQHSPSLFT